MVIGYYHRLVVEQHPLQSAIGTSNDTHLFSKPGKNKIEHSGKNQQSYKSADMLCRTFLHVEQKFITSDEVGQKDISNQKRNDKKQGPFQQAFSYFLGI